MWYACVYGVCSVSVVCVCVFGTQIHFFLQAYMETVGSYWDLFLSQFSLDLPASVS